jgi:hypothetical protein
MESAECSAMPSRRRPLSTPDARYNAYVFSGTEIGVGGLAIGAVGLAISPWTTWLANRNEHQRWLRERRFDTYTDVLAHMVAHREWREAKDFGCWHRVAR